MDRIITGLCALFITAERIGHSAVILKHLSILGFHRNLVKCEYRRLFSPIHRGTPGPKGPSRELINGIFAIKQRKTAWGCPRIATQISLAFGVTLDKDIAYRVLSRHYRPLSGGNGPSRLTFLGQVTDSLWSVDLYRCESAMLKFHWVLLVMDHYTRRTVGFEAHAGIVDGPALCSMFNRAIHSHPTPPVLEFR
jgi:hypothetical protein